MESSFSIPHDIGGSQFAEADCGPVVDDGIPETQLRSFEVTVEMLDDVAPGGELKLGRFKT